MLPCCNIHLLFTTSRPKTSPWWSIAQWNLCPRRTSCTWRRVGSPRSANATPAQDALTLKIHVLLGLVKPRSFAGRNEFLRRKLSPRTDQLWSFSTPVQRLQGGGRYWRRISLHSAYVEKANRQARFGNVWKWIYETTTGASFIHLLVLATLHCLALRK